MERNSLPFVRRNSNFLLQLKRFIKVRRYLPAEYANAFEEFKDIKSIDRIEVASWMGFTLAIILLVALDTLRYSEGKFNRGIEGNEQWYILFYFHLIMLLFIIPAIYISKRKSWIIQTRMRRGVVIWGMVIFCFVAMLAQSAAVYLFRDTLTMFIGFIFTSSWMFSMSHRERLLFFSVSLLFMSITIGIKGIDNKEMVIANLIEVIFLSVIAFLFDFFDYNQKVTNFLNQLQIESEQKRIRALEAFKTRFFTNLTHEFRTPLTIITGMAREIADNPNRWAAEGTQQIRQHAGNLLNLVNQILDLSRLENSSMPVKWVQGDIISFLSIIMDAFKGQAVLKRINIHYLPPPHQVDMDFDPDKLTTILSNILSNAIKFTPEDGNIYVSIDLQQNEVDERLLITIKDNGIGIPADELDSIFERFYQVSNEQSRAGMGTGIGLSLAKELTQLLGGKIAVMSTVGKGTQFTIELPVHRVAPMMESLNPVLQEPIGETKQADSSFTVAAEESDFTKPDLLIIEDHADIIGYLQICLADIFNISISRNGEEGVRKALEIVPDIIVSDVLMPGKDGLAVCRELKHNPITSHIPILLLSAKTDTAARVAGLESGADVYMLKPFEKDELRAQLRNLLNRYQRYHTRYEDPGNLISNGEPEAKEDEFITRVRKVIMDRLDDSEFSVFDLERGVFLSRSQLHKKLKALTGLSAMQFVNRTRLLHAREKLTSGSESVSDIAYQVGFSDPNYFSRAYSEAFHETPSDTRKKHKTSAL